MAAQSQAQQLTGDCCCHPNAPRPGQDRIAPGYFFRTCTNNSTAELSWLAGSPQSTTAQVSPLATCENGNSQPNTLSPDWHGWPVLGEPLTPVASLKHPPGSSPVLYSESHDASSGWFYFPLGYKILIFNNIVQYLNNADPVCTWQAGNCQDLRAARGAAES